MFHIAHFLYIFLKKERKKKEKKHSCWLFWQKFVRQTFLFFFFLFLIYIENEQCDLASILKVVLILGRQQNIITHIENESTQCSRKSTLRDVHVRVSTAQDVRNTIVQK